MKLPGSDPGRTQQTRRRQVPGLPRYRHRRSRRHRDGNAGHRAAPHGTERLPARGHRGDPADTAAGYGCISNLPDDATGFTTIELKSNFVGTARDGTLECSARAEHAGRTTQVWAATVAHRETGRTIALFRCTQLVIYPN
jgi:hypothetical protein